MSLWQRLAEFSEIETPRLWLRPFRFEDAPAFYELTKHPDALTFLFPAHATFEEAAERLTQSFLRSPLGTWAIEDKKSSLLLGFVRFENIAEQTKTVELSYFLSTSYRGQGLMTEAVQTLVALSFSVFGLKKLSLITHIENKASQRVAQKAGFDLVKTYKGSDRYTRRTRIYQLFEIKNRNKEIQ